MKHLTPLIPILLVSACVNATPTAGEALCQGTRQARAEHAAALAVSVDDRAVVTGYALISKLDSGCAK